MGRNAHAIDKAVTFVRAGDAHRCAATRERCRRIDTRGVSLTLLHQLAQAQLPVNLFSGEEVDRLRVLQLAGHVKAVIPLPVRTLQGYDQPPATVQAVTPLGQRMIRRFPSPGAQRAVAPAKRQGLAAL